MPGTAIALLLAALSPPLDTDTDAGARALVRAAISESAPSAWALDDTVVGDFRVEWEGAGLPEAVAELVPDSVEWVRLEDVVVVPRARLRIVFKHATTGHVVYAGTTHPLRQEETRAATELEVALFSGPQQAIEVQLAGSAGAPATAARLWLRRKPHAKASPMHANIDHSCSPFGVTVVSPQSAGDDWFSVGCRRVYALGMFNRTQDLQMVVVWDNAGDDVEIGGASAPSPGASIHRLSLAPGKGPVLLRSSKRKIELHYSLVAHPNYGMLGVGIGPYFYSFTGANEDLQALSPLVTVYGAYSMTDTTRIVAFGAVSLNEKIDTDIGLYLNYQSLRILDRRVSMNILLGAHLLAFVAKGQYQIRPSAPQGLEFIFRDAFLPGYNFLAGAFLYPPFADTAYGNVWVRYGNAAWFVEVNGIYWQEPFEGASLTSQNIGVSVGMPLVRFF